MDDYGKMVSDIRRRLEGRGVSAEEAVMEAYDIEDSTDLLEMMLDAGLDRCPKCGIWRDLSEFDGSPLEDPGMCRGCRGA